jgi:hypothetical protein
LQLPYKNLVSEVEDTLTANPNISYFIEMLNGRGECPKIGTEYGESVVHGKRSVSGSWSQTRVLFFEYLSGWQEVEKADPSPSLRSGSG